MTDSQDSKPSFGTQAYWRAELYRVEARMIEEQGRRGGEYPHALAAGGYKALAECITKTYWPGDGDFAATIESES